MELHPDLKSLLDPDDLTEDEFLSKVPTRYREFVEDEPPSRGKHRRPFIPGWD